MSNLEELEVNNMCSLLGDHTCRVRGCTTSGRYVRILIFLKGAFENGRN